MGTKKGEVIRGTARRDIIVAKGGNDRIYGRGGKDLICAGPGNDLVVGGPAGGAYDEGAAAAGETELDGRVVLAVGVRHGATPGSGLLCVLGGFRLCRLQNLGAGTQTGQDE